MTSGRPSGPGSKYSFSSLGVEAPDNSSGPTSQTDSGVPAVIGDYQILRRLGGGAMAELFVAQKVSCFGFVRRSVVKRVRRSRPDGEQLQEMLLDEARATACFDHPNLVSLLDVGETDQGVYLALEYIDGADLRQVNATLRSRKEALPFELAAFIVVEVLRGLHHAHTSTDESGRLLEIVHRDVNPSNVLIARSGHIKLADFGVVRMRERVQPKTEPGLVKGKYAYLAPEYIAGEPCSIQTDVYAAGIMLFELLSGRECFAGKTAYEVMWKIVNKGVPMHRLEREGVPKDLQRIVQRATAMAPERRYPTAQDMANALEAWLTRSGRHATPWVLSVFFHRHELLPSDTSSSPPASSGDNHEPNTEGDTSPTPLPPDVVEQLRATKPTQHPAPSDNYSPPRFPPIAPEEHDTTETSPSFLDPQVDPPVVLGPVVSPNTTGGDLPSSGKMEEIPSVDVLARLMAAQHTGVVEFRCGLIWKKVTFVEGKPSTVTSNMGMELIGEHLVKSKLISREQLNRSLEKSERAGHPLSTTLLEDGILSRIQLEEELGRNLAARLHEVLEWRWGTFELKNDAVSPVDFVPRFDLEKLLEEARTAQKQSPASEPVPDQEPFDPQKNLEKAIGLARSIESSSGRGQIERPWRPEDS